MNREYLKARCFEDEDENWWQRRTRMERSLFIGLIIIIIFSIGCAAYITVQILLQEEICASTACLSESYKITTNLNKSIDPCEDFLNYVCGQISNQENVNLTKKLKKEINLMLDQEVDYEPSAIQNEKKIYESCVNQTNSENFLPAFQELLDEIGGWPVLMGYRWRARLFEWTDAIYSLQSRGYPFTVLLSAKLSDDGKIEVSVVNIKLPNKWLYKQLIVDTAVVFGADEYQAKLKMEYLITFMEELKNITEKNIVPKKPDELFGTNLTVNEIQKIYDEIQWLEFLNNVLYPQKINEDDIVMIPSHEYLGEFFDVMSAATKRVQADYIIWKVIEEMMPFMSENLQYLKGNYSCQTEAGLQQDRREFCQEFLDTIYIVRPLHLKYIQQHMNNEKEEAIEKLFSTVKDELSIMLRNGWLDDESVQNSVEYLEKIGITIGAPNEYFNASIFEEIYTWEAEGENVFEIVLNARKNYLEALGAADNNSSSVINLVKGVHIEYSETTNAIVIPVTVLEEYFNEERPMYLNYAELGVLIGDVLLKALLTKIDDLWTNSTLEEFKQRLNCDDVDYDLSNTGLNLGYRSYQSWLESRGKEAKLIGMNENPNQLFWISALSAYCIKEIRLQLNHYFINDFKCVSHSFVDECDVF